MIDTPARRREIIEILYFADDYVKIRPLAVRFGVSYATIRNDVDELPHIVTNWAEWWN